MNEDAKRAELSALRTARAQLEAVASAASSAPALSRLLHRLLRRGGRDARNLRSRNELAVQRHRLLPLVRADRPRAASVAVNPGLFDLPLSAAALDINSGVTLAIGSCLYLGTGMLYGILFHVVQSRFAPHAGFGLDGADAGRFPSPCGW